MITRVHETADLFAGGSVDASGQPQQQTGRIDISKQRAQTTGIFATAAISGACLCASAVLGLIAFCAPLAEPPVDPRPFAYAAGFFFSSAAIFALWAGGISGRLLRYACDSELIIAAQDLGIRELRGDNQWLINVALFRGADHAPIEGAAAREAGESLSLAADAFTDNERAEGEGQGSSSATVHRLTPKPPGRFQ